MISIPSAFSQEQGSELQDYSVNPLGISFKYPSNWNITYDSSKENKCESSCLIVLKKVDTSNVTLSIYAKTCNCGSLLNVIKDQYTTYLEPQNITLIQDGEIELKNGIDAWQMEYLNGDRKNFVMWFLNNGFFYELNYYNNDNLFTKHLSEVKAIIDTMEFFDPNTRLEIEVAENLIDSPQPSFMNPTVNQSLIMTDTSSPDNSNSTNKLPSMTGDDVNLNSEIFAAVIDYYPAITLEFISNSTVALKGDEEFMLKTENDLASFWKAIDEVKQFGYNLDEITESGMGSELNPTRLYAVMSQNTKTDDATMNEKIRDKEVY